MTNKIFKHLFRYYLNIKFLQFYLYCASPRARYASSKVEFRFVPPLRGFGPPMWTQVEKLDILSPVLLVTMLCNLFQT